MRNICKVLVLNLIYAARKHSYISFTFTTLVVIFSAVSVLLLGASVEGRAVTSAPAQKMAQTMPLPLDFPAQVVKVPTLRQGFVKKTPPTQPPAAVAEAASPAPTVPPANTEGTSPKETTKESVATSVALRIGDINMQAVEKVCRQGRTYHVINNASLTPQALPYSEGAVTWAWEVRLDSGHYTEAPLSTELRTVVVAAGNSPAKLMAANATEPLVAAPVSSQYAYSFRLYVSSPNDVTSDWVSVPQAAAEETCAPA